MKRVLVLLVVLMGSLAAVGRAAAQTTTTQDPDVPAGCFVASHVYEGDQFGDTFAVTVDFVGTTQPPYNIHVVVSAQPGYWLMRVKGGWIGPGGEVQGIDWSNPDGVANRSYSFDAYGAGIGIRGIACPIPMTTSTTTIAPPSLMCPAPGALVNIDGQPVCVLSTTTTKVGVGSAGASAPVPVVATPSFTG